MFRIIFGTFFQILVHIPYFRPLLLELRYFEFILLSRGRFFMSVNLVVTVHIIIQFIFTDYIEYKEV